MTSAEDLSCKYVFYSHYSYMDDKDYVSWRDKKDRKDLSELHSVQQLRSHLGHLRELLAATGQEGMLVLFYAPKDSFPAMLDGIAEGTLSRDKFDNPILPPDSSLHFARDVIAALENVIRIDDSANESGERLLDRVRIMSPLDLWPLLRRANWNSVKDIRYWFIGREKVVHYDSPKIVEAIVRLRLLGTGVPVFRIDHDVLFNDENAKQHDLALIGTVSSALSAYQARRDLAGVATFLFSVGYDTTPLHRENKHDNKGDVFKAWGRAFATRLYPALLVKKEKLEEVKSGQITWDGYCSSGESLDVNVARQYYGLDDHNFSERVPSGIARIGAHPYNAVISGALFCLSTAAIVDLPPFSNFGINVMWIDDHLKYCLHRELRHLFQMSHTVDEKLRHARIENVYVTKDRPPITNLPGYVFGSYLPTLLWGCVMDRWITRSPLLKYRSEELSADDKEERDSHRQGYTRRAPLPSALANALERGAITRVEKAKLKQQLEHSALERINEVRHMWLELRTVKHDTFASLWAGGGKTNVETKLIETELVDKKLLDKEGKWRGIAPNLDPDEQILKVGDLNPALITELMKLIDDAVDYIEWTLSWPTIIQLVRSVEQGSMKVDVRWRHGQTPLPVVIIENIWNGADAETIKICDIKLRFDIGDLKLRALTEQDKQRLFESVQPQLLEISEHHFGKGQTTIKCVAVALGCMEIVIEILTTIGTVAALFRDYHVIKTGIKEAVEDTKQTVEAVKELLDALEASLKKNGHALTQSIRKSIDTLRK